MFINVSGVSRSRAPGARVCPRLFCQRSGIIILMGGDNATISARHLVFKREFRHQTFVKSTFNDQTGLINLDVFNVFTPRWTVFQISIS